AELTLDMAMPNGDHLSLVDSIGDDNCNDEQLMLRYRVGPAHPTLSGRLLTCVGRRIKITSQDDDELAGFGLAPGAHGADADAVAALFASGWTCYSVAMSQIAAADE